MLFDFSYPQLSEYFKCLRNLKPGDKVEFHTYGGFPYWRSNLHKTILVIAEVACITPASTFATYYSSSFSKEPTIVLMKPSPSLQSFYSPGDFNGAVGSALRSLSGRIAGKFRPIGSDMQIAKIIKAQ